MDRQYLMLVLFIVLAVLIMIVFYAVYRSSHAEEKGTGGMTTPSRKRFLFFLSLAVAVAALLSVTLPRSPYFVYANDTPSGVVEVSARQFSFEMSYRPSDADSAESSQPIELPLNQMVEFRVSSVDVNHGLGIYNEKAELVAQTQAMPGYINKLRWKFDKPGDYNILCLEFCGVSHAFMRASFKVK